ncbi:hypothetical protein DED51_004054, partial [Escherichia coli]|nr:hypothetical protein [Escherichia coli]
MAPLSGEIVPLDTVPDAVFAGKIVGDGIAIRPSGGDTLMAPVSGTIGKILETNHAFSIRTDSGTELFVHFGINTVDLRGEGFRRIAQEGQLISTGDPVPALRDRIVQRAMLMAMEPIWESDFHTLSYGFRPESSVHHAIRTVKLQLTDCGETRGRWVIEGDLSSYFDTVHHRLLMKAVRRRISDARFMTLLWKTIKAGHIDVGLFRAASEGVPQGGVISPLLSNIMLNEFDQYLHERYLSGKARKDQWYWNNSIQRGRSTAVRENWQWKPAVAYCRYADDFVLIVKGTKAQAEAIREECRGVLEGSLKLRLNMDKTKITHVNDGFIFLGHRIIRKRSRYGEMRVVSTIPQEKARNFAASLTALLSGNYSESKVDMAEQLNRKLKGWAMFYQFVDFKAKVFSYIDRVVFWKLAHWLARKYRTGIASLMRWWCKSPKPGQSKTWVLFGKTNHGKLSGEILYRLVGQ